MFLKTISFAFYLPSPENRIPELKKLNQYINKTNLNKYIIVNQYIEYLKLQKKLIDSSNKLALCLTDGIFQTKETCFVLLIIGQYGS